MSEHHDNKHESHRYDCCPHCGRTGTLGIRTHPKWSLTFCNLREGEPSDDVIYEKVYFHTELAMRTVMATAPDYSEPQRWDAETEKWVDV